MQLFTATLKQFYLNRLAPPTDIYTEPQKKRKSRLPCACRPALGDRNSESLRRGPQARASRLHVSSARQLGRGFWGSGSSFARYLGADGVGNGRRSVPNDIPSFELPFSPFGRSARRHPRAILRKTHTRVDDPHQDQRRTHALSSDPRNSLVSNDNRPSQ